MKNYSDITENLDITTKQYVDSGFMPKTGGIFTGDVTITPGHLKTDLIKSADNSKWIAEFTAAGLEIGGSGTPLRFYSSTRPVVANQNKELAYTSDIPAAVTDSTVLGWGFTKNAGTVTSVAVKMNGAEKGKVTSSGTIDLGTVLTDASKFATSAQGTKADNAVPNTRKVNNKALSTDIKLEPSDVGVTESAFPGLKKTGTITGIKMNGASKGTSGVVDLGTVLTDASKFATSAQGTKADTALQSETDPTVPPWAKTPSKPKYTASEVGALSLDGGTINKSKTIKMDASANSDGANLKWGTVNHKNPYIGYASDQVDGTFVVGSLLGTNYASGLAIGGGSGNLLWKGTKVATTSDITAHSNIVATQTTLGHIKMYVEGDTLYLNT